MGASADILYSPGAALLIGAIAGFISVLGFSIIGPILQRRLKIYDTCGVHNLHGMPSVLGAIASSIVAAMVYTWGTPANIVQVRKLFSLCVCNDGTLEGCVAAREDAVGISTRVNVCHSGNFYCQRHRLRLALPGYGLFLLVSRINGRFSDDSAHPQTERNLFVR